MQPVVPAIRVSRYEVSKSFYESLGFAERWLHRFGPGFPIFASLDRGGMQVFLTEHTRDCAFGCLIHFYVDDVDACHAEFTRNGVTIAKPPNNDLGADLRQMLVTDPDGNRLSFLTIAERRAEL